MDDLELIAPPRGARITFAVEPVYNILSSLILLSDKVADSLPWARETAARLTPEQLRTNQWAAKQASRYVEGVSWPGFPAWLDDLAARDPYALRDAELDELLEGAAEYLGEAEPLPTAEELLADADTYLALLEQICQVKGHECDLDSYRERHERLQDPPASLAQIVAHLRMMWEEHLAADWEKVEPLVQDAVAAFSSVTWSGRSTLEVVCEVIAREEAPADWDRRLKGVEELVFIPSAHISPYVLLIDEDDTRAWIVFGVRVPEGATVQSPALTRSELLTRLAGLADDTRLRILKLVAEGGELRSQDIMEGVGISQSSASRQLRELVATGYLSVERRDGAKVYRLKQDRISDTLGALQRYLETPDES